MNKALAALRDGIVPHPAAETAQHRDAGVLTVPNAFTVLRFGLIVPAVISILQIDQRPWLPLVLVAVFSLTDWVDGFLARLLDQYSRVGAQLDPFADRLGLGLVIIALTWVGLLPLWAVIVIAVVDLTVGAVLLRLGVVGAMSVTWAGKFRTAVTMLGTVCVLAGPAFAWAWLTALGSVLVQAGAVVHVLTGLGYLRTARRLSRSRARAA